ncbi:MAG: EAL domain-containing protein [Wenzhouxiangella sp.]|jgi:diguanylate cyclase (GGDEF)-like protein|nr:EAL domain-containing protein [Wenzhouxiangella sp.]
MKIFRRWRRSLSTLQGRIVFLGILPAALALLSFSVLFLGLKSVEHYRLIVDTELAEMNMAQQNSAAIERAYAQVHEAFSVSVRGDVIRLKEIRQEFEEPLPGVYDFLDLTGLMPQPVDLEGTFDLVLDAAEQLILGDVPASQSLMVTVDGQISAVANRLMAFALEKEQTVAQTRVQAGQRLRLVSTVAGGLLAIAVVFFVFGMVAIDRWIRQPLNGILSTIKGIQGGEVCERLPERKSDDEINRIYSALNRLADHEVERRQTVERLDHLAHYDPLTNLPNRVLLSDLINQEMLRLYGNVVLAVIIFDIDEFKDVNDSYGHEQGDELLRILADRIEKTLQRRDTLGRIGGDEFVVMLPEAASRSAVESMTGQLLDAIRRPLPLSGHELEVTACAGIAVCAERDAMDSDQLLRHAEQALYQAKQSGANNYHIFDFEQQRKVRAFNDRIGQLEHALMDEQFTLFYQPKINLYTGELVGVEALIRWLHPQKGLVAPADFLPDLERHALALDVGRWVIKKAISASDQWRRSGIHIPVAVNLFPIQLQRTAFVKEVIDLLAGFPDLPPEDLELEIVESAALDDLKKTSEIIKACASHGLEFTLDDFGTGYSSLTYLRSLPVSTIKLDQSFVRGMVDARDDEYIIRGIMNIATAFDLKVVAEGVETIQHGLLLQKLGCEVAQGYAIAKPMPFEDVRVWLNAWVLPDEWRQTGSAAG